MQRREEWDASGKCRRLEGLSWDRILREVVSD